MFCPTVHSSVCACGAAPELTAKAACAVPAPPRATAGAVQKPPAYELPTGFLPPPSVVREEMRPTASKPATLPPAS